jgi:iron(III) transport system ATP-binding protein
MKQDYLILENLVKIFQSGKNALAAVDNVSVKVREGELVTLLGPSGCGKTTTLRMIAGFEIPTSGKIFIEGKEISMIPPNQRSTTMVFQNYALFPHMTVFENISYGLRIRKESTQNIKEKTEKIINLVGLEGLGKRSPAHLSGGQQQRVSLARSLIMEPKVLLLDEPLSNLDAKLRESTRLEIRRLQQRLGITSVYVTHDQEEAMTLSDRVVIMNVGRIQQVGTPQEIYAYPNNYFVADFIGNANFMAGKVHKILTSKEVEIEVKGYIFKIALHNLSFKEEDKILLLVRPEAVDLKPKTSQSITGIIQQIIYLGSHLVYKIKVDNDIFTVEIANPQDQRNFSTGEEVSLCFKENSLHILSYEDIKNKNSH